MVDGDELLWLFGDVFGLRLAGTHEGLILMFELS